MIDSLLIAVQKKILKYQEHFIYFGHINLVRPVRYTKKVACKQKLMSTLDLKILVSLF